MNIFYLLPIVIVATSCASSSSIPLAKDTVQISSRAAPACGRAGAQKVALKQAAVETINRGYDSFIVLNSQGGRVFAGTTPVTSTTTGSGNIYGTTTYTPGLATTQGTYYGTATTTTTGGVPLYASNQDLIVKMFKAGDPLGANALDARQTLGPDWQEQASEKSYTCL